MEFKHPQHTKHLEQRDQLLADSLRQGRDIVPEFPIVLQKDRYSIIGTEDDQVLCHANLWPRTLRGFGEVFLVGNVATRKDMQGKGLQKELFHHLFSLTEDKGPLILWSDLTLFYKKIGLVAGPEECRIYLNELQVQKSKRPYFWYSKNADPEDPWTADKKTLLKKIPYFNQLRLNLAPTLERSDQEFIKLLTIPDCELFWVEDFDDKRSTLAYILIGKGEDMQGVVHEWATQDPTLLVDLLCSVRDDFKMEHMLMLGTEALFQKASLTPYFEGLAQEKAPMCWLPQGCSLADQPDWFVWGLDSI